jgi:hypothetical protein
MSAEPIAMDLSASDTAIKNKINTILDGWERDGYGRWWLIKQGNSFEIFCIENGESLETTGDELTSLLASVTDIDNQIQKQQKKRPIEINGPSTTKSRGRPLDPIVAQRRDRLVEMAEQSQPATVRQLYYLAETGGLVPKAENGYRQVQHDVLLLRRDGRIPL